MKTKNLGELVTISKGKKHEPVTSKTSESKRYIQIEDLRHNDSIKYTLGHKGIYVEPKDIIIAWDGSKSGTIGYGLTGFIGSTLARLRLKDSEIYPPFLGLFLQGMYDEIRANCTGAAIPHVNKNHLINISVPLPPLDEQKRIAAILDKADAIRRKRAQALELADEFLKSAFLDMFGDPVTNPKGLNVIPLKEAATFLSGGTPSKSNAEYWQGEFPWVSPKDMKRSEISDSVDHISHTVFKETNLKKVPQNTILLVVRGMILAHTVPLAITTREVAINQDMKAILPKQFINSHFLLGCLLAQHGNILNKVATAAHGTKRLEMREVESLPILNPNFSKQKLFANVWEKTKRIRLKLNATSKQNHDLFNSLVQRAFHGELGDVSVADGEMDVEDVGKRKAGQLALF